MYNILICDDQPDIVNALKIYLASDGYRILEAFNGQEAVKLAKSNDIHLILMDIMMVLGLNVGADDYITKPFVPAEVLARVRSQLRRYAWLGSHTEKTDKQIIIGGIL